MTVKDISMREWSRILADNRVGTYRLKLFNKQSVENPVSTRHKLYGPCTLVMHVTPQGITVELQDLNPASDPEPTYERRWVGETKWEPVSRDEVLRGLRGTYTKGSVLELLKTINEGTVLRTQFAHYRRGEV